MELLDEFNRVNGVQYYADLYIPIIENLIKSNDSLKVLKDYALLKSIYISPTRSLYNEKFSLLIYILFRSVEIYNSKILNIRKKKQLDNLYNFIESFGDDVYVLDIPDIMRSGLYNSIRIKILSDCSKFINRNDMSELASISNTQVGDILQRMMMQINTIATSPNIVINITKNSYVKPNITPSAVVSHKSKNGKKRDDSRPVVTRPVVTRPVVTRPVVTRPVVSHKSKNAKKIQGGGSNRKLYEGQRHGLFYTYINKNGKKAKRYISNTSNKGLGGT